ncbi:MAG: hypothetical protein AAB330_00350, partial [Bacteroidota bacterium]
SYVAPKSTDPDRKWRYHGIRPITRNKLLTIAAHMTAAFLYPKVFAQNDADEEDKMAQKVMADLMMWNAKNSDYESAMLFGIIGALKNPAVIIKVEFAEAISEVKRRLSDGSVEKVKVLDEVLSGFKTHLVPCDELLIENFYQYDIQRQRFLIRRRFIGYEEAKSFYGSHGNFKFVKPGVRTFYSEENGRFYDQVDDELKGTLVEEATYYNRQEDLEVPFLNGIYHGETSVEANPMKHRRLAMTPKGEIISVPIYPFAKGGFEPIDERRFFYYMSAASKFAHEQAMINTLYRMVLDGTMLSIMKPLITSGAGKLDSGLIIPGAQYELGPGASVQPFELGPNLGAGWQAVQKLDDSISESSQSPLRAGIPEKGEKTAFEIRRLEENARTQLGIPGRMIGEVVVQVGHLMIDVILQHETVADVEEILGGETKLKYRSFVLPESTDEGKKVTKRIVFTDKFLGKTFTEKDIEDYSYALAEREGGPNADLRIYEVNPELFRRRRFLLSVEADQMLPKSEVLERALKMEAYAQMANDPYFDPITVRRDFLLEPFVKGEADRYLRKPEEMAAMQAQQPEGEPKKGSALASGALRANQIQSGLGV